MSDSIPLSDLGSSPGFPFNNFGDKCVGRILRMEKRQQTDLQGGGVKTFKDGTPMMMTVITLRLADGSEAALYARAGNYEVVEGSGKSMAAAITEAARAAGASSIDAGAELAVAFTGLGKATGTGRNQPKLYTAQYKAATASVPVDDLFSS